MSYLEAMTPSTEAPSPAPPVEAALATSPSTLSRIKPGDIDSPEEMSRKGRRNELSPPPGAGHRNSSFGSGERMEPVQWPMWARMLDKHIYGAHYNYIVGNLTAQQAAEDAERRCHDEVLADELHNRRPSEAPHYLADRPRSPMHAAFTDRSLRMREGRGAKPALLLPREDPSTEWGGHGDCSCEVCKPFAMRAAGNPSHHVHYNRVNRCFKDSPPTQPHWEKELAHTFNSEKVGVAMEHITDNPSPPADEERTFMLNMGCKIKSSRPQSPGGGRLLEFRSMADDPAVAAGQYNQDRPSEIMMHNSKARQPWQGGRGASPLRSGVSYVLDPHVDDPPVPSQIVAARKADGAFKHGSSKQSEGMTSYFNQEVFRFADPSLVRGRSVSPPRFDNAAGVGTNQWPGSPRARQSPPSSPRKGNRSLLCNNSATMASVMSREAGEECFAQETAARMKNDAPFKELCKITSEHHQAQCSKAEDFKQNYGHGRCTVSSELQWKEH